LPNSKLALDQQIPGFSECLFYVEMRMVSIFLKCIVLCDIEKNGAITAGRRLTKSALENKQGRYLHQVNTAAPLIGVRRSNENQ